jgi:hypothetical protein
MIESMSAQITTLDKLALIKKVIGFANLHVIPAPSVVQTARAYVEDVKQRDGIELKVSEGALTLLHNRLMPRAGVCVEGMDELDVHLRPLRHERRELIRNELLGQQQSQVPRPRAH